jgi:hypothetical protein
LNLKWKGKHQPAGNNGQDDERTKQKEKILHALFRTALCDK